MGKFPQTPSFDGRHERITQLAAPVDGVIQQWAIYAVGGVVTSAQPLLIVAPDQAQVTAEVSISHQDIGFVNAGQLAEVKQETFTYTRYGTVDAAVNILTADAATDENRGSYYPAVLTLSQNTIPRRGVILSTMWLNSLSFKAIAKR